MKNRLLFYSSVTNIDLFYVQRFYSIDIDLLTKCDFAVTLTNRKSSFLYFWKYDVSFFYFYKKSIIPAIMSKLFGKHIYFTGGIDDLNRDTTSGFKYILQKFLFIFGYILCTKCIVVSRADYSNIFHIFHRKLKKIELSYHAIDIDLFELKEGFCKQKIFTSVVWMGSKANIIRKGVDTAIYVFSELLNTPLFESYNLFIIGQEGEGTQYLKSIIQKFKLGKRIIFTGALSEIDKISFLHKSKYYFQLSEYEGFGLAALEALSSGNIVIHSGEGGLADSINNHGIVFNIHNNIKEESYSLYKKLLNLSESDLIVMQNNGSEYVKGNYSLNRRLSDFVRILKK